jgi:hypothetical protein
VEFVPGWDFLRVEGERDSWMHQADEWRNAHRALRQAAIEFESDLSEWCDGPARDRLRDLLHGEAA